MWMVDSLRSEFAQQSDNAQSLVKLVHSANELINKEVNYKQHFDPELLLAAQFTPECESDYLRQLEAKPNVILLGCSNYAKAAVVNELIGQNVLPTVAAEEHLESANLEHSESPWRNIILRYGEKFQCKLKTTKDCETNIVDQPMTPSDCDASAKSKIPIRVLQMDGDNICDWSETVDISLCHTLLGQGATISVPSFTISHDQCANSEPNADLVQSLKDCTQSPNQIPLPIYVISTPTLTHQDLKIVKCLRLGLPDQPVLFLKTRAYVLRSELPEADLCMRCNTTASSSMDEGQSYRGDSCGSMGSRTIRPRYITCFSAASSDSDSTDSPPIAVGAGVNNSVRRQLISYGCLAKTWHRNRKSGKSTPKLKESTGLSDLIETVQDFPKLVNFVKEVLRQRMITLADRCQIWLESLLKLFIFTAYDMARDQLVTPKRVDYAKKQEKSVYKELCKLSMTHPDLLQKTYIDTLKLVRFKLLDQAANITDLSEEEVTDHIVDRVQQCVGDKLAESVNCLRESFVGTLQRCVDHVTKDDTVSHMEIQHVKGALQQLLNSTYSMRLDVNYSDSLLKAFWQRFKKVHCEICCMTRTVSPVFDSQPQHDFVQGENNDDRQLISGSSSSASEGRSVSEIIEETMDKLESIKLAKVLNLEFRLRIKSAHETFQGALERLQKQHTDRLAKANIERLKLRKQHAPRLSRYAMESLALKEMLTHGMPRLGHEIGRGQYGVVYSAEKWGMFGPCAIKSVVPPDDKHWNDLAMEFYYTRSLLDHPRIVRVYGAVIDHDYGGGSGQPAVLLIMQRFKRDLYIAIKMGLGWLDRLTISVDVVEGLRYLHSRGLVHRDIKLKNVLLDDSNRAKITDLGFCKPEAMMSGSIVGTPIHMAPELFTGYYDASVDVYAFGVLFWYICAGHVHLPSNFQECLSKDHLWDSVRNGVRPEQLQNFQDECWQMMKSCWDGVPDNRPMLGDIQPKLEALLKRDCIQPEKT